MGQIHSPECIPHPHRFRIRISSRIHPNVSLDYIVVEVETDAGCGRPMLLFLQRKVGTQIETVLSSSMRIHMSRVGKWWYNRMRILHLMKHYMMCCNASKHGGLAECEFCSSLNATRMRHLT